MLNLREFRSGAVRLADWLPWACLIAPGIVLNKDGSFQRTVRYRGPDLDSATEAELMSVVPRRVRVTKARREGWIAIQLGCDSGLEELWGSVVFIRLWKY